MEARLLSRGIDTLEVAHETLLRLPPISDWLEEDREFLAWRDRLIRERASYETNQRGLLVGRELQIARDMLKTRVAEDIAPIEREFVELSLSEDERQRSETAAAEIELARLREHEALAREQAAREQAAAAAERERAARQMAEASRRVARRTTFGLVAALLLALLAGGLGTDAIWQRQAAVAFASKEEAARIRAEDALKLADVRKIEADAQRDVAVESRARFIGSLAREQSLNENTAIAALLKREISTKVDTHDGSVGSVIRRHSQWVSRFFSGSQIDASPDGTRLLVTNEISRLFDPISGEQIAKMQNGQHKIRAAFFAHEGQTIITITDDVVEEWEIPSGKRHRIAIDCP